MDLYFFASERRFYLTSEPEVISYKDMVDKIDPILLLIGSQPEQKIRQICQEEMVRYGVIDSYSVSSNRRNGRG